MAESEWETEYFEYRGIIYDVTHGNYLTIMITIGYGLLL